MARDRELAVLVFIILLGAVLRLYGIPSQEPTADDVATAYSAVHYMEDGMLGPTMWNHPPLRNILVYGSLRLLGSGPWGVKAVSLALGSLTVLFLALVARRLFPESGGVSLLAAFFLAIDPVHIDFSRQAVHEVYMACFFLAGIYSALRFRDENKPLFLVMSGVAFGLGLASKWYVALPLIGTIVYLFVSILKDETRVRREKAAGALFVLSALVLVPFAVYMLTFIPWFGRGHTLPEWFRLQYMMYNETITHTGYTYYGMELDHRPLLWFLKPVGTADVSAAGGKVQILIGISNPAVWLLTLPSICYIMYQGMKKRLPTLLFVGALFWITYIPMALTKRPLWVHTAFAVLPFAFLASAYAMLNVGKGWKGKKAFLVLFLAVVIAVFIPLYLLAIGKGFETAWLRPIVELYRPSHERGLLH